MFPGWFHTGTAQSAVNSARLDNRYFPLNKLD